MYGSLFKSSELVELRQAFLKSGVCVCVCVRARGITYAYLTYVSSNAVHEDTRTVSLSELESILVSLRFMDADSVYKTKQVLVMIDVWKYCL